jgi:hypothetical protein
VEEAYKAFGEKMSTETTLDFLEGYTGRIWLIDLELSELYYDVFEKMDDIKLVSIEKFYTAYRDYSYSMILVEKTN